MARVESISLDKLPVEVLQNIASHASGEAAVCLSRVCRRLRSVCFDCLVFKSIIVGNAPVFNGMIIDLDGICRRLGSEPNLWARYAVANSRVADLAERFPVKFEGESVFDCLSTEWFKDFANYAPHLVTLKHPIEPDGYHCISSGILLRPKADTLRSTEDTQIQEIYEWLGGFALHLNRHAMVRQLHWLAPITVFDLPWTSPGFHKRVAIPFSALWSRSSENRLRRKDSLSEWLNSTTLYMTNPAFLEEGEWCGYYARNHGGLPLFDPPMRNIKFNVSPETRDRATCDISAVGTDDVGKFVLKGSISRTNGTGPLWKTYYVGALCWTCGFWMTPFGLFGRWHGGPNRTILGWFWLWKSSWTGGGKGGV